MKNSYNDLSYSELLTKREELRKQYQDVRFNRIVGHVDNPLQLRIFRRNIAAINTIIHEYDLKIRQTTNGKKDIKSKDSPAKQSKSKTN